MNGLHGIIFSYESRNDLKELVEFRSSASVPFGGRYRMVDFALSNLVNAGVTDVGVVLHGRYQSMIDHLGSGKVWDHIGRFNALADMIDTGNINEEYLADIEYKDLIFPDIDYKLYI